jgi:hypothetical protein
MIHPAGWVEASQDGKTLFAGFTGTHGASILDLGETNCRPVVDNHFLVFADIQEIAHAKHGGVKDPTVTTEANMDQSFFATGLPDKNGEILCGFSQWCDLFKGPDFGRSQ